ncbi:MAG: hypothetical protein WC810_02920 [Janthinobacterium sp.]|jgi:hypothetical protein
MSRTYRTINGIVYEGAKPLFINPNNPKILAQWIKRHENRQDEYAKNKAHDHMVDLSVGGVI